jgi:hypothetical protein
VHTESGLKRGQLLGFDLVTFKDAVEGALDGAL